MVVFFFVLFYARWGGVNVNFGNHFCRPINSGTYQLLVNFTDHENAFDNVDIMVDIILEMVITLIRCTCQTLNFNVPRWTETSIVSWFNLDSINAFNFIFSWRPPQQWNNRIQEIALLQMDIFADDRTFNTTAIWCKVRLLTSSAGTKLKIR